ncbi:hypothetical protein [Variovorax saccharolyticus]|uniref:hypothetical protein n=1 Tax=Variovorax saccharolyticus TaxID=3053516 RepID=UPI002575F6B2|nr:hypothetical protein [Variovorax sp. J31P216]MDM0030450.1 hypothetical protein [Variovorax sp. J31P216]
MNSVDNAYQVIAESLNSWANVDWKLLEFRAPIYPTMCGGMSFSSVDKNDREEPLQFDWNGIDRINNAVLFLRDTLLHATGQRVWGIIFTLHSDGKFNIQYDYIKPEGYEETDQTIDVSLADFADQINRQEGS